MILSVLSFYAAVTFVTTIVLLCVAMCCYCVAMCCYCVAIVLLCVAMCCYCVAMKFSFICDWVTNRTTYRG